MLTIKMHSMKVLRQARHEIEYERTDDARRSRLFLICEMINAQYDEFVDVDEELYKFLGF